MGDEGDTNDIEEDDVGFESNFSDLRLPMLVRGVGCTGSSVVVLVSSNDAWEVFTVGWDKPDKVPTEEEEEEVDEDGLL